MRLRIVTWNVNMALRRKRAHIEALDADVAVLQEVARADLAPDRSHWTGHTPHKGLGVEVRAGLSLEVDPAWDQRIEFVVPYHVRGPLEFTLFAVWAMHAAALSKYPDRPERRQVLQALDLYEPLLRARPCVFAGDFNNGLYWDRPGKAWNHANTVARMAELELVSAYHAHTRTPPGQEGSPTLYWTRNRLKTYHIDYVFLPAAWLPALAGVCVGTYAEWVSSGLSDHVPVIVDIETSCL